MKPELVNAVIHGLKETLTQLSPEFDKIEIRGIYIKEQMFTAQPVVVQIGFSGGIKGMVAMSMDLQTAINIADLLLVTDGSYASGFTEVVQSSIKEVANMFAGSVAMFLSSGRQEINILVPKLSFGSRVKLATPFCPLPVSMLLRVPGGPLEFDICLSEDRREEKPGDKDEM